MVGESIVSLHRLGLHLWWPRFERFNSGPFRGESSVEVISAIGELNIDWFINGLVGAFIPRSTVIEELI